MFLFRTAIFLLLVSSAICFALYAGTNQERYKRWGLVTLKWTVLTGLGFFAVLILERIA